MKRILKAAALVALASGAVAEDWTPPGPIKLMIAEDIEAKPGWKFIPEQVTGKGGMNLAMAIKGEAADGTVIGMVASETMGYNMVAARAGVARPSSPP